jgi:hypothetical protein
MAMSLVSTVTVGSGGVAAIEFTSIPATGKDLLVLISPRANYAGGIQEMLIRLNGDTGNNYASRLLRGNGSAASSSTETGDRIVLSWPVPGGSDTANTFGNISFYISNYTSTTNKSISTDGVGENNATGAGQTLVASSYTTSSAISSIALYVGSYTGNNIAQHSTASLYIIS